jgi:hypothetical protein
MAKTEGSRLVGTTLRLCALGSGVTGVTLLPVYPIVGAALCVVAVADLGLFWLLKQRLPSPVDAAAPPR